MIIRVGLIFKRKKRTRDHLVALYYLGNEVGEGKGWRGEGKGWRGKGKKEREEGKEELWENRKTRETGSRREEGKRENRKRGGGEGRGKENQGEGRKGRKRKLIEKEAKAPSNTNRMATVERNGTKTRVLGRGGESLIPVHNYMKGVTPKRE